jgi:hypothetical protein
MSSGFEMDVVVVPFKATWLQVEQKIIFFAKKTFIFILKHSMLVMQLCEWFKRGE